MKVEKGNRNMTWNNRREIENGGTATTMEYHVTS
jgi:hypothetical protein